MSFITGSSGTQSILTGGQNKLLKDVTGYARNNLGRSVDVYQGSRIPGANANMQAAFGGAQDLSQANPNIMGAINQQLAGAGDPAGVRSMYESALAPARTEFDRTLQQVGSKYGDVWGSSGAHQDMVGRTVENYGNNLNSLLGNLTYNDRQAAMNRQLQAIPAAISGDQNQRMGLQSLLDIGQAERGVAAQGAAEDYEKWFAGQAYNNPWLGLIGPALGTQANVMTQTPGQLGGIVNAVTGGVNALSGLAGLFGGGA